MRCRSPTRPRCCSRRSHCSIERSSGADPYAGGKYGVSPSASAADLLDHPGVKLIVNLTIPAAHVPRWRAKRSPRQACVVGEADRRLVCGTTPAVHSGISTRLCRDVHDELQCGHHGVALSVSRPGRLGGEVPRVCPGVEARHLRLGANNLRTRPGNASEVRARSTVWPLRARDATAMRGGAVLSAAIAGAAAGRRAVPSCCGRLPGQTRPRRGRQAGEEG